MIRREHLDPIDYKLGELSNLCAALEVVAHELNGTPMEGEWDRLRRDALVGVIDATVAKAKEVSADFLGLFHVQQGETA